MRYEFQSITRKPRLATVTKDDLWGLENS